MLVSVSSTSESAIDAPFFPTQSSDTMSETGWAIVLITGDNCLHDRSDSENHQNDGVYAAFVGIINQRDSSGIHLMIFWIDCNIWEAWVSNVPAFGSNSQSAVQM